MSEENILYKKIALRFLKETGLLVYWKEYLRSKEYLTQFYEGKKWYEQKYILSIFGATRFSDFLKNNYNIYGMPEGVYLYFGAYLEAFYPSIFYTDEMKAYFESHYMSGIVSRVRLFQQFPQLEKEYEMRRKK